MSNKYALLFLLLCVGWISVQAQTLPTNDTLPASPQPDSLVLPSPGQDTLQLLPPDTLLQDSLLQDTTGLNTGQAAPVQKGDIETTINYSARDSIRLDFRNKTMYMYGTLPPESGSGSGKGKGKNGEGGTKTSGSDAKIDYGKIKLEAAHITTNWGTNMLAAEGLVDSTGKTIGRPVFTDGPEQFVTDDIKYNFKTRKAIIHGVVTQQQDAYIHGETIKKTPDNELLIENARYTTCNLEEPHFHIEAERLKVLPGDKVISGPFHLKIADISTPFGFLFGMFPAPKNRVSGVLFPRYGEERVRGFFLQNGGYYWAINDYIDLAATGEIYSKGSYGFSLASNYRKRYAYNGNINIRYNRLNTAENEGFESYSTSMWVTWNHSPQTKGKGRFNASVNGGTSNFTTNNPSITNMDQNLQQTFSSNLSYSYSNLFNLPLTFSSRASLNQKIVANGISPTDLILPDVSLMMSRQFPFKREGSMGKTWWEQISVGYTFKATNRLSNSATPTASRFVVEDRFASEIVPFNTENLPTLLKRGKVGGQHSIPISTSFNVAKYFQVSPSFNYNEYWFLQKLNYNYNDSLNKINVDTVGGFHRAGVYNAGASVGTKVFGTFYFNKKNPQPYIQAIRHMLIPTASMSYSPDFSHERYGYYREIQNDVRIVKREGEGNDTVPVYQTYSVYEGAYRLPGGGKESATLNFNLTNNFEMKVRSKDDTTQQYKKVPLLRNLTFSSGYDLLAEEFKLRPVTINGNTSFLNNLITFGFNATLDPYTYRLDSVNFTDDNKRRVYQERIDAYAWNTGNGIGRIERAGFNISSSLSPATFKGKPTTQRVNSPATPEAPTANSTLDQDLAYIYDDPNEYVDFTIPWTLRFNYTFQYSKLGFAESAINQSASFSGDIAITEKWKLGFNSGYDFRNREFVQTRLSIFRDLHCWQMNVNWVPFGRFTSFSVDINVKSSTLQDLKLSRRRSWFDY